MHWKPTIISDNLAVFSLHHAKQRFLMIVVTQLLISLTSKLVGPILSEELSRMLRGRICLPIKRGISTLDWADPLE